MAASIALPMVSDQRSGNQLDVLAHAVCAFLVQTMRAAPTVEETWRFLLLTLMKHSDEDDDLERMPAYMYGMARRRFLWPGAGTEYRAVPCPHAARVAREE